MSDLQRALYERLIDLRDKEIQTLQIEVKRLTNRLEEVQRMTPRRKIMRLCLPKMFWK